jgi:hypothetical protein
MRCFPRSTRKFSPLVSASRPVRTYIAPTSLLPNWPASLPPARICCGTPWFSPMRRVKKGSSELSLAAVLWKSKKVAPSRKKSRFSGKNCGKRSRLVSR